MKELVQYSAARCYMYIADSRHPSAGGTNDKLRMSSLDHTELETLKKTCYGAESVVSWLQLRTFLIPFLLSSIRLLLLQVAVHAFDANELVRN